MKPSLAIKTLFRTMGKTLFTFLLIAVLTFSLFIQLAEYFKTQKEFEATVDSYSGTGYMEYRPAAYNGSALNRPYYITTDPRMSALDTPALRDRIGDVAYPPIDPETVAEIEQLPYISSVNKRYMTAGVSDQYRRLREDQLRYDFCNRIIVEGTVLFSGQYMSSYAGENYNDGSMHNITWVWLTEPKILAGDAALKDILFDASNHFPESYIYFRSVDVEDDPCAKLQEGDRIAVVCTFDRQHTNVGAGNGQAYNYTRESLIMDDLVSSAACPPLWDVTDAPENYLEQPEYAPLQELIEITQTDLRTFDVVYVDDVSTIRRVHDDTLHLTEGRWLTQADSDSGAKVCVLDRTLALRYELEIGDKLPLQLGHELFEQFYTLGAIAGAPARFSDEWTEEEFEIVGFYTGSTLMTNSDDPNWSYSMNTVMVPLSALPLTEAELEGHAFYPGELSFRVENAWDIEPFLREAAPQIEAMGLTLDFDDGGWMQVLEGYRDAQRIPLIRIVLLAFVTVTGLALSVYLFVSRKKKDYAIMRALGTPKGRSANALLAPMAVLSLAAVLLGAAGGLAYSLLVLRSLSALPPLLCIGGELAFTLAFTGLSLWRLSKLPPLELLQAGQHRRVRRRRTPGTAAEGSLYHATAAVHIPREPLPITKRPASLGFRLRYVWRHIRRQGLKSLLSVLLAALLVGAVTQLASLRDTYNELRDTTAVTVKFVNSLSLSTLQALTDEGFTKNAYYERAANISCLVGSEYHNVQIVITSDPGRFLGQDYEIDLGEGYTEADLAQMDYVLAAPELLEARGLQAHDTLWLATSADFDKAFNYCTGLYYQDNYYAKGLEPDRNVSWEEIQAQYSEKLNYELQRTTAGAEVIGTLTTANGSYQNALFTSGLNNTASLVGTYQTMPLIEFTLSDNSRLEEMRERGEALVHGRRGAFVMDTEALERVIRSSDLLNGLYPAVVALALLIGAALCALLVMQTTKDAAIMRIQGTTKRTTRFMLAVEQILLGLGGIVLGLLVMLAWKRGGFVAVAPQAGLFALAYALVLILGSNTSAGIATRKNILELLQTKE